MVTWGQNQVFTFGNNKPGGAPAPAGGAATGFSFGSTPAPAPAGGATTGFSFGSTPAPAPGSTGFSFGGTPAGAPPPAGGGLFGSSPAPAPSGSTGGSLFGRPASGSLFGTPSPAPSAFGASSPAPSAFGSTPSLFGSTPQTPTVPGMGAPAAPQMPAQAAMQAHMDASAKLEAAKLQTALEALHQSYAGTTNSDQKSSPFVTIVYNFMTPEQLQWQSAHQQSGGGLAVPPRPPQVSEQDWSEAVVNNPDPERLIPVALIGSEALRARIGWQQEQANNLEKAIKMLDDAKGTLQEKSEGVRQRFASLNAHHNHLRKRMLAIMSKVELARCMNLPLQNDEVHLARKMGHILQELNRIEKNMASIPQPPGLHTDSIVVPNSEQLAQVLKDHRQGILQMTNAAKREMRDIETLQTKRFSAP